MRRFGGVAFAAALVVIASGHIGSPNMIYDGLAGPYPVRVIVRPPDVVPGLAEVIVRTGAADVQRVVIRPVFWRVGVKGAPTGDEIHPVPGSRDTYSGHVWLMSRGSYSVYVTVEGGRGAGTAIVPVNAFATGRLSLSPALEAVLLVLASLLIAGLITIIRAAVGESLVPPGEPFTAPQRRRANLVTLVAVPVVALLVFGGAKWWSAVDGDYQRTMFHPPGAAATITVDGTHRTLHLAVIDTSAFRAVITPIVPDHGKMMHLFLVGRSGMQTLAHLHPTKVDGVLRFTTEVPWLPAGRYFLFGDFVEENGTALTVATPIDLPPAPGLVTPSDSDDTWDRTATITTLAPNAVRLLGHGYAMAWTGGAVPFTAGQPVDLSFEVRDSAGNVAQLKPYLGMAAHAVVVSHDASVFIHLHPMGTIATVSQQIFALRDRGDTTSKGRLAAGALDSPAMSDMSFSGALTIPYEFPKPGRYRIWVQVKPADAVLTGTFDVDVR